MSCLDAAKPPTQAVILAGGRGSRLAPLTDTIPKPMVEFHGLPFLAYLLDMLKGQGIEKVVLLLGYLPDVVVDYFGDGRDFGIEIEYSITAVENDTGARVRAAKDLLDPHFLLMYCDNYWPLQLKKMWQLYIEKSVPALVTVYANDDGYTRDNLRVTDGMLEFYDKTREAEGLKGVDIGFMILNRDVIDLLPEGNVSFEASLYPKLVAERKLAAFVTGHRYYSVGDHRRLPMTKKFLERQPCVILDRDGVLNQKMPQAEYVCNWSDWTWIDGALEAISMFSARGYKIVIVTNQAGIARGAMTEDDLADIHRHMIEDIENAGGHVDTIYYCPHGWDDNCTCRKPAPGMLFKAQQDLDLDLSRVCFIGDDERDGQAAERAGCLFEMVSDQIPLNMVAQKLMEETNG